MPTDASSLPDETKTILNDAKFSYHTKFNKFHHYHDFLSSPQWNDFFVLVDNDTVLSLAIPFEDVGKMTRSYLVANRLKANDSLFYYVQIVKKKKERAGTFGKPEQQPALRDRTQPAVPGTHGR